MSELVRLPKLYINWLEINISNKAPLPLRIRKMLHDYSTTKDFAISTPDISVITSELQPEYATDDFATSTPDFSVTAIKSESHLDHAFNIMLIVGMVVTITVCVVGSLGNLLTVSTLIHQIRMPVRKRYIPKITSDTILILNLCVADFCYSFISLPFIFIIYKNLYVNGTDVHPLDDTTCKWAAFFRYTNAITEWTTLGIMALERCVTIYRFQRKMLPSTLFTSGKTVSYCVVLWLIAIAAQTLTLTETYGEFGYNNDTLKCDFMPTYNSTDNSTDSYHRYVVSPRVFFFALESAVPCFCILIGYIVILTQVYSSNRFFRGNNSLTSATQMSMALRRSKTTRLIVILLTIYLMCVIPICIYNVVIPETKLKEEKNQIIGIALYCLYWFQYGVNNFIYVVSNEKYRRAYGQFFNMILCKDVPSPSSNKYLKMLSYKQKELSNRKETPKMRLRTPSEMTLECIYTNGSLKGSQTKINFISSNVNIESLKEIPILVLPRAHLNSMCISIKKTGAKCRAGMISSIKGRHRNFDFKWNKRRLSLDVTEKLCPYSRKRSLSV